MSADTAKINFHHDYLPSMSRGLIKLIKRILIAAILVSAISGTDVLALDPERAITQYINDVWQDELPQNTVLAITQTQDGYIWLGTYEGLVRFDGISFTAFDRRSTKELSSNAVFVLQEDSRKRLWIGTNEGLNFLENGKFGRYSTADGLSDNDIKAIYEDRQGNLWIGTDSGLNLFKDGKFTVYKTKDGLSSDNIRSLFEDRAGRLWIGTLNGLNRLENWKFTTYTTKDGLSNNGVRSICEDREGNLWLGTNGGGICRFKDGKFTALTMKEGLSNNYVQFIRHDRDGNIWAGTNGGGLNRFRDGRFSVLKIGEGLSNDFVRAIYEDREGSLWIGTNNGLNCLKEAKFTTFTTREGLSNDNVRVIYEGRDGSIWIGTDGGGIGRLKNGTITNYTTKDGLSNDAIRSFCEDRSGNLWVGTNGGGLNRFKDGKFTVYTTKDGLSNDFIYHIYEDRAGNLWIGTTGGGLNLFKDGKFTAYNIKEGLSNKSVREVYEDRQGGLWVGTISGLNLFKDGKFTVYTTREGLSNDTIFALYEDTEGSLWIGTNGGLNRFKDGKFRSYSTANGLFDDTAFRIMEDAGGYLWMSCNRGVYRVKRKEFDDFDRGMIKSISCSVYTRADGLGANQCNGASQPAGYRSSDGRLWFPTIKGASSIDPEKIKINELPPPVTIEEFIVDNRSIGKGGSGESALLSSGSERFEFHYTAFCLVAPQRVRFRYRLEGFDRDWIEAGVRRTAYYTNIPPGEYSFKVIACNNDGVWNETGDTLMFELPPPWWRTWWAYLLYIFAIAGTVYSGVRLRLQTLERRNMMLEAKVAERTSELDRKNEELAEKIDQLAKKNGELAKTNDELIESYKKADRIFSALAEALPGTVLDGKYQLEEKIGTGGYGAVYRARHLTLNRPIAVKIFRPAAGNDSMEGLERFRLEGVSACRVNHPNAITILDSGISDSIAYLVMELLEGHSLAKELETSGRLTPVRAAAILLPVCNVLAEAHRLGIVHRDIKPDNIFLHQTKEGEVVKVVDFGIAKLMGETTGDIQKLTVTGGIIGTVTYMAPERLSRRPYDGSSDVYSLGVMMYQMLCGHVPFDPDFDGLAAVVLMHLKDDPEPLSNFVKNIPEDLESIVMQAMAKNPQERPTPEEMGKKLAIFLAGENQATEQTEIRERI
jgi:ligand-binding sensor domain-containing protein